MGWHIGHAVVRGEIDNTVPDQTTGRIWVRGREEPVELDLRGNCWRDLAGMRMEFENHDVEADAEVAEHLAGYQHGMVGDITVSKRVRVLDPTRDFTQPSPFPEDGPYQWINCLYIEWFAEQNGRVFIQLDDFEVRTSEPEWRMSAEEEEEQLVLNMAAMRVYIALVMGRDPNAPEDDSPPKRELSEFEWEKRIQESDRMALAYREALQKYKDDPDSERKSAYVMGWDRLLEAMDDEDDEEDPLEPFGEDELWEDDEFGEEFEDFDGERDRDDWENRDADEDFEDIFEGRAGPDDRPRHPVQSLSELVALKVLGFIPEEDEEDPNAPLTRLIANIVRVHTKLNALDLTGGGHRPEIGFILAMLKRCLNYLNEALSACQELLDKEAENSPERQIFEALRHEIFEIRNGVVELRREMRRKWEDQRNGRDE
jgi:hypothetical protein